MSKTAYPQTNFGGGEFSPQLEGRVDLAKYASGVKILENMVVKSYGGAFRRPGQGFVAEVADSTMATRLYPFQFSTTQAYVLEFGHHNIRVYYVVAGVPGIVDSGGGVPVDIPTLYDYTDLFELQFAQSADVLYITHHDYPPRKLSRTSHTAWTIADIDFTWGPWLPDNATTTTVTPSGVAGAITIASSADVFLATQIGALFRIKLGYVKITGFTNTQLVDASVIETFVGGATTDWSEGAWSNRRGYPAAVSFYEQRLWFAGSLYEPQTLWASQSDDFENMKINATVLSTDALVYTISDNQVNSISWLLAVRSLVAGSKGGAFIIGTGDDAPITPTNVRIRKELSYRCAPILPKRIGANLYYLQDDLRVMRELSYDFTTDSFSGADITVLSEHITESGIVDMDYQQSPDNLLWCVRADGEMAVLTRQVEQQVVAWSRMTTNGKYESVAVIPNGTEDMVWVIVNRTIGGSTKRYVEYFKPFVFTDQEDAFFVDSGLSVDVPLTITGITSANPPVVSCVNTFVGGEVIKIRGVIGMTEVNNKKFTVNAPGAGDFELYDTEDTPVAVDGSTYSAYESGGQARECFTTVAALDHINGEKVSVLVDGAVHPDRTVVANSITLDGAYSEAHVGLKFTSKIQTLKLETGLVWDAGQGIVKKIFVVIIRLYKTVGCKIGLLNGSTDIVPFRTSAMLMDEAVPLFTGDKKVVPPQTWGSACQLYVEQDLPLPLNVLLILSKIEISES